MKTLPLLLDDYIKHCTARGNGELTVISIMQHVARFLRWTTARGVLSPAQLNAALLSAWQSHLNSTRNRSTGVPLKPQTINHFTGDVRRFLEWLCGLGFVPSSLPPVLAMMRVPPQLPPPAMTHSAIRSLLRSMPRRTPADHAVVTMVEVLYSTGIRPCELLRLKPADFQADPRMVRVAGKGRRDRMVPLGKHARKSIDNYIHAIRPLLISNPGEEALWLNSEGRRMAYDAFRDHFLRLRKLMHLDKAFTAYTLRRTCATELVRSGMNIWLVKELLGHGSLVSTNHYVALVADDIKKMHTKCHPRDRMDASSDPP